MSQATTLALLDENNNVLSILATFTNAPIAVSDVPTTPEPTPAPDTQAVERRWFPRPMTRQQKSERIDNLVDKVYLKGGGSSERFVQITNRRRQPDHTAADLQAQWRDLNSIRESMRPRFAAAGFRFNTEIVVTDSAIRLDGYLTLR